MSIFNNTILGHEDEIVACEGYGIELGGNFDAMMESFDDDLAIIEAMHAFDMAELAVAQGNTPEVTTEASIKAIWEKIKTFFANLGKKILAFFKSLMDYLFAVTHSGKEFYTKYKDKLSKLSKIDVKYDGYEYTINDMELGAMTTCREAAIKVAEKIKSIDINKEDAFAELTTAMDAFDNNRSKALGELRKALSGEFSSEKYSNGLFKTFRNNSDSKKEIKVTNLNDIASFLGRSDSIIDKVKKANEDAKKNLNKMTTDINTMAAEAAKVDSESKYTSRAAKKAAAMRAVLSQYQQINNIYTMYLNAYSSAVKEAIGTYKSVCLKALKASY